MAPFKNRKTLYTDLSALLFKAFGICYARYYSLVFITISLFTKAIPFSHNTKKYPVMLSGTFIKNQFINFRKIKNRIKPISYLSAIGISDNTVIT